MKAMNRAGLVQKDVQVRGKNGQTFTRKQWVKAGEEQSTQNSSKSQSDTTDIQNISFTQKGYRITLGNSDVMINTLSKPISERRVGDDLVCQYKGTDNKVYEVTKDANETKIAPRVSSVKLVNDTSQSSSTEENTMEARKKLKEEIDNYVKTHNPPSDEDRKKVSDMRDKYQQMVKESMDKTKKQISENSKSEQQDTKPSSSTEKKQDTTSKNSDKQVIGDKFNFAYAGDTSEIKKTDEIRVGDKIGYVVTRKVSRNGGDHSFSGTVYSAVFDGKPIKVSDANDNKITPINYEDDSAFRDYNDCVNSLKSSMNSSSESQSSNGEKNQDANSKTNESTSNTDSDSSSTWKKVGSSQEAKQQIASMLASGKSREDCMNEFKKLGVTWKENDHAGINWMRASMAMNKYLTSETETSSNGNETKTDNDKPASQKKQSASVIGSDYTQTTTEKEAKTIEGEAHNMMVGKLKSETVGKKKPTESQIKQAANSLKEDAVKKVISSYNQDELVHQLAMAKQFTKLAGGNMDHMTLERTYQDVVSGSSYTQEQKCNAMAKLLGSDYTPDANDTVARYSNSTDAAVHIRPLSRGNFEVTFTYGDGAGSTKETYDSVDSVKKASDKWIDKEDKYYQKDKSSK